MRRLIGVGLVLTVGVLDLRGDIGGIPPAPPMPQPVQVEVFFGESVRIPLRAMGRSANTARFLLRSQPTSGTLSELRIVAPGQAVMVYKHDGVTPPGLDSFLFAAQSPDSPVSAAARVDITVRKRPAVFRAPSNVRFPETMVGGHSEQEIILRNEGGETLRGIATTDGVWEILHPEFKLDGGESHSLIVRFSPDEARQHAGSIHFSHAEDKAIRLEGIGMEALLVQPRKLELHRSDSETSMLVSLKNQSGAPLEVQLEGPSRWGLPKTIQLEAEGEWSLEIPLHLEPIEGDEGRLIARHPFETLEVPFQTYPLPGKIVIEPESELEFGKVEPGTELTAQMRLSNPGGLPVQADLFSRGGDWDSGESIGTLQPGDERLVELKARVPQHGTENQARFTIRSPDEEQTITMRWEVELPPDAPRSALEFPKSKSTELPAIARQSSRSQESFDEILVTGITEHSVTVEWLDAIPEVAQHEVQRRSFFLNDEGEVQIQWDAFPNVQVRPLEEDRYRATFFGLQPGERLMIRVISRDFAGSPLALSSEFGIMATPRPHRDQTWWKILLGVAVVVAAIILLRKRKDRTLAADRARADQLEKDARGRC